MVEEKQWRLSRILAIVSRTTAIMVVSFAVLFVYHIYRGIRPPSRNHVLLVNGNQREYRSPLTIKFTGEDTDSWNKTIQGIGTRRYSCVVIDIKEAFFPGQLAVIDGDGEVICTCEVRPPGRIHHTAVVLLPGRQDGSRGELSWDNIALW